MSATTNSSRSLRNRSASESGCWIRTTASGPTAPPPRQSNGDVNNAMTTSSLFLDDQKLVDLYMHFQHVRRSLGVKYANVAYHDFVDIGSYDGAVGPAQMIASEQLLAAANTAANTVNRFCYEMHALAPWEKALESVNEDEKFLALFEFVAPVTADCLSQPYSIRQMLIKSICHISHQTNRFHINGWNELALKPDKQLDFKEAKKLASHFASWPVVCANFARLND